MDNETLKHLIAQLGEWGPLAAAFIIFCVFGLPNIAPIITALGNIYNERHKTNLSHKRSMSKIENQIKKDQAQ
ncbi:hypothetical protein AGR7C_Lc100009 [Agrobacterium deltaense Zutra 3/1]|uniref:Uncharacterized protein n=1 Tax=Agrobacterium deltaense Zutra 3/1 TaxID=1183427 RepID=A0A1S7QQR1_9HYPH|nr:hypothetical protein AGR7C_Lc100009 [Agrobacterium deltaense Zutra 3/1]